MDAELLQNLGDDPTSPGQQQALQYFEQLKNSDEGWKQCTALLRSNACTDDRAKFFAFQILEHFIKTNYSTTAPENQGFLREFMLHWIRQQGASPTVEKKFIRNKAAQVFSLMFIEDFPRRWPEFFQQLMLTLNCGTPSIDIYLRVLVAIDSEITDHDIPHTPEEIARNNIIKDAMRETSINKLVHSWLEILKRYSASDPFLVCLCLQVIGSYILWIDITLIANNQFIPIIVKLLLLPDIQDYAADCLLDIINKGMDPIEKVKLVECLYNVLEGSNLLIPLSEEDTEYTIRISKLLNGMGMNIVESHSKMVKSGNELEAALMYQFIENKIPTMLEYLSHEYDDVSMAIMDFAREYIHLLKSKVILNEIEKQHASTLLLVVVKKMKYDESYNFESEGEDEAIFIDFRKQLKILFDNLAGLDKDMVLDYVHKFITSTLLQWQNLNFAEVEVAIMFLYLVGEAIPATGGNHFTGDSTKATAMKSMMEALVTCGVSSHPHPAVVLQFFETVVRYEKFFNSEPEYIGNILTMFLDERGMRNSSCKVRSRSSYLFSRLVKGLKNHMQVYTKEVLVMIKDLLILSTPSINNGMAQSLLSDDDQLFVYETCGVLIVSGSFTAEEKGIYFRELLLPLIEKFSNMTEQLAVEQNEKRQEELASCLCHAMALTSRTSKAFSNQQTMKTNGCVQVFLDALPVFLSCLQTKTTHNGTQASQVQIHQQHMLQSGVRQFLHRMVVCLEDELLPYIPTASEGLLKISDVRSFMDYVPLLIQIITKFKKNIVPFLQHAFSPIVSSLFNALATPIEENDEQSQREKQMLQRSYYQFLASIVTNNVTEVLSVQESQCLDQVMTSLIRGAVDHPDPTSQKICFSVLRRLVEVWGAKDGPNGFVEFMYKEVISACFMAPAKPTFDLVDAQALFALNEVAMCMKAILDKRGDELLTYLTMRYMPTLNLSPAIINEYCQALKSDPKAFKIYIKLFFQQART